MNEKHFTALKYERTCIIFVGEFAKVDRYEAELVFIGQNIVKFFKVLCFILYYLRDIAFDVTIRAH